MNTFKEYQKSITIRDSEETKVRALELATFKESKLLSILRNLGMPGKYTDVPITKVPAPTDTAFVIGGVRVTKELTNAVGKLTDETLEDSSPNMEVALDNIVTSLSRAKLEKSIADHLVSGTATVGSASPDFATILSLLSKFPETIHATEGKFVAAMSYNTWLTVLSKMTPIQYQLVKDGVVTLAPIVGMDDKKMSVFHTHGVLVGFGIRGIEKERNGSTQSDDLIIQLSIGYGADSDYIKYVTLA